MCCVVKVLGGNIVGPPFVTSKGFGSLNDVGVALDLTIYHNFYENGSWFNDWENLRGNWISSVEAVTSSFLGIIRLGLFAIDAYGSAYQNYGAKLRGMVGAGLGE